MTFCEAIDSIKTTKHYAHLLQVMFNDNKHTLTRGYVLQVFTEGLIENKPQMAREIRRLYNNFLYKNYHPLEFLTLFL
jgi:hypothetical protein